MLAITSLVKNNCGKDFFFCYDTAVVYVLPGHNFPIKKDVNGVTCSQTLVSQLFYIVQFRGLYS